MFDFIQGVVAGAILASIAWFLIWRNNKNAFVAALHDLNYIANTVEENSRLAKRFTDRLKYLFKVFDRKI